jgi:hypothetical protein
VSGGVRGGVLHEAGDIRRKPGWRKDDRGARAGERRREGYSAACSCSAMRVMVVLRRAM